MEPLLLSAIFIASNLFILFWTKAHFSRPQPEAPVEEETVVERPIIGLALADQRVKYRLVKVKEWGSDLAGRRAQNGSLPSIIAVPSNINGYVDHREATGLWVLSNFRHSLVEWEFLSMGGWDQSL